MKTYDFTIANRKLVYSLMTTVLFICIVLAKCYFEHKKADQREAEKRFMAQIGTYILDIKKTKMDIYASDTARYKNLTITFRSDSTFTTNMYVPFLYDTGGRWVAGGIGLDVWNWLTYMRNPEISTQFDKCCFPDSTFLLNSATPREGNVAIPEIWFKKIY